MWDYGSDYYLVERGGDIDDIILGVDTESIVGEVRAHPVGPMGSLPPMGCGCGRSGLTRLQGAHRWRKTRRHAASAARARRGGGAAKRMHVSLFFFAAVFSCGHMTCSCA